MPKLIEEATQDIKSKNLPVPKMYIKRHSTVDEFMAEYGSQTDIEAFEARYHTKINYPEQAAEKSRDDGTVALDLLLVEWLLAIELERLGHVLTVLPILIGEKTDTGGMLDFSARDANGKTVLQRLPDIVPLNEAQVVQKFLLEHGLAPSPELSTRTVREVVTLLKSKFLCVHMWELCGMGQLDLHGGTASAPGSAVATNSASG